MLIYFDHNSTTPMHPQVLEAVMPYLTETYGNAASRSHPFGWKADVAVTKSRESVANILGAAPKEIVFTSGATEAINLALKGIMEAYHSKGNHVITLKTEHKAVLDVCDKLERQGAEVTYLDVDKDGCINLEELKAAITEKTVLVAAMWANNETGLIHPMKAIGDICREHNVFFMTDATQAVGKLPINVKDCGIHLLACSAHKFGGMKGVGALYVSNSEPKVKVNAIQDGGGHERGRRSGTLNVPGIVSLGKAADIAIDSMEANSLRLGKLRDYLEQELLSIEESYLNGHAQNRMSHVTNISFKYIESEALIATFNQSIAVSTGSACTSASLEPSHVLLAQGLSDHMAHSAIRFSLGMQNTIEEIEYAIDLIKNGVKKLRAESPIWQMYKDGVDVDSLLE